MITKELFAIPSATKTGTVNITFDGQPLTVPTGINVASALLVSGVRQFRSTAVSQSGRAPYCMMGICFECLVEIDGVPARQSCLMEVRDGMQIRSQQGAPEFLSDSDEGEAMSEGAADMPVDLIVIGCGPAGMAAACEARSLGLDVLLLDEQSAVGGQIYRRIETAPDDITDILGKDYAAGRELASEFRRSGAAYVGGAVVWNVTRTGVVNYVANGQAAEVSGKFVLIASGAMERPFPIKGWTLPGVMGAGAGQIMLKGSGALPSEPVILAGCGPLLYLLAWQYIRAGVRIKALVDTTEKAAYARAARYSIGAVKGWRDLVKGIKLIAAIRRQGVKIYSHADHLEVLGDTQCQGVIFTHKGKRVEIEASLVLLHQGVVPNTQLSWSLGEEHRWNDDQLCWHPVTDESGRLGETSVYVAGDSRAIVGANASAVQGRLVAIAIAQRLRSTSAVDRASELKTQLRRFTAIRPFLDTLYRPRDENRLPPDEVLVCRCEEVTAGQIRGYVGLGCKGPNQTKAFGRCGMGPCQGRLCGLTVTEVIAEARKVEPSDVGYYRIRPPIKPILLGDFTA